MPENEDTKLRSQDDALLRLSLERAEKVEFTISWRHVAFVAFPIGAALALLSFVAAT